MRALLLKAVRVAYEAVCELVYPKGRQLSVYELYDRLRNDTDYRLLWKAVHGKLVSGLSRYDIVPKTGLLHIEHRIRTNSHLRDDYDDAVCGYLLDVDSPYKSMVWAMYYVGDLTQDHLSKALGVATLMDEELSKHPYLLSELTDTLKFKMYRVDYINTRYYARIREKARLEGVD